MNKITKNNTFICTQRQMANEIVIGLTQVIMKFSSLSEVYFIQVYYIQVCNIRDTFWFKVLGTEQWFSDAHIQKWLSCVLWNPVFSKNAKLCFLVSHFTLEARRRKIIGYVSWINVPNSHTMPIEQLLWFVCDLFYLKNLMSCRFLMTARHTLECLHLHLV